MSGDLTPEYLREHRSEPSVLKVKLSNYRERHPCDLVLVLEGNDDLPVYEVWLNRLKPGIKFEPLVANGKKRALEFFDVLSRDATGMSICTYFIVDHDYDGMRGRDPSRKVFVLPAYSIENFLVSEESLDSILRTDLKVVGDPETRAAVLDRFRNLRSDFIKEVKGQCEILFGARNERTGNVDVQENVMGCFRITTESLEVSDAAKLASLVRTERPVSAEGLGAGAKFLADNDPTLWVRGKYLLAFYKAFIRLLCADRRCENPVLFPEQSAGAVESPGNSDPAVLASRSPIPLGLDEAITRWMSECECDCESRRAA